MRRVGSCLLAVTLAACSATGEVTQTVPFAAPLGAYRTAGLSVTAEGLDDPDIVGLVEAKLGARLTRAGVFERASSLATIEAPDVEVRVRLLDLSRVSTTGRALVGGLAGRGGIRLEVTLVDPSSEAVLGALEAEGKSSGGTVFSGRTGQAIDQALDRVVSELAAAR